MICGFSSHQVASGPNDPIEYPFAHRVAKVVGHRREMVPRSPVPELLIGSPGAVLRAVRNLATETHYRAATLTFARTDIAPERFNAGDPMARAQVAAALELFIELAFAGIPADRRLPLVAGTHTHVPGQLELNLVFVRAVLNSRGEVRSHNVRPPGTTSKQVFDTFCDLLNHRFGWADPGCPTRAARIKLPDYLHKEIAEAGRAGARFDRRKPRHYIAQQALACAERAGGRQAFLECLAPELEAVGFEVLRSTKTTLRIGPPGGGSEDCLTLKGWLIDGRRAPAPEEIEARRQVLATAHDRYLEAWHARARQNRETFGYAASDCPAPDVEAILEAPTLWLPPHHPDWTPGGPLRRRAPGPTPGGLTTLLTRVTAALAVVRARLADRFDRMLVGRWLPAVPLAPFLATLNNLEKFDERYRRYDERHQRRQRGQQEAVGLQPGIDRSDQPAARCARGQEPADLAGRDDRDPGPDRQADGSGLGQAVGPAIDAGPARPDRRQADRDDRRDLRHRAGSEAADRAAQHAGRLTLARWFALVRQLACRVFEDVPCELSLQQAAPPVIMVTAGAVRLTVTPHGVVALDAAHDDIARALATRLRDALMALPEPPAGLIAALDDVEPPCDADNAGPG